VDAEGLSSRVSAEWLTVAVGLVAAVPVIVAAADLLHHGWVPLADNGVIVLRSWDVLTGQSPLVGQYSLASVESVGAVYSPGPMEYWLLALPVRLFGPASAVVTIGLVNVASIMGSVALARRRAGTGFMFVAAIALVLMCRSLPSASLATPFNATVPLISTTLLMFLAWSVACGEYRLIPLSVLVASFAVETHLSYVPPVLAMVVVAGGGLALAARRSPDASSDRRRWLLAGGLVAVICWSAPLVDELAHRPGNLTQLWRTITADRATLGIHSAWNAVVHAFGVPPWWLRAHVSSPTHFLDVAASPSRPSILAFLTLIGLLGLGLLRRRRAMTSTASALGLLLIGALALVTASTPGDSVFTLGYTMQLGSPAGMFTWLAAGLATITLVKAPRFRLGRGTTAAGVACIAALSVWAATAGSEPDVKRWIYEPAGEVVDKLDSAVPSGRRVFVQPGTGDVGSQAYPLIVYALRRNGDRPLIVQKAAETNMGGWYGVEGRPYDFSVAVIEGSAAVPERGCVVDRIALDDAPSTVDNRTVKLALVPCPR
jgi:MYXO-CTERM domain-containing protein